MKMKIEIETLNELTIVRALSAIGLLVLLLGFIDNTAILVSAQYSKTTHIDFYKRAFDAKEKLQTSRSRRKEHYPCRIEDRRFHSISFRRIPPWRMHFAQVFRRKFCYTTYLHRGCR